VGIPVIASGGVGELNHFLDGLVLGKADAVLAASVFHFGTFSIQETKKFLRDGGVNVRLN
jgi:cyclase